MIVTRRFQRSFSSYFSTLKETVHPERIKDNVLFPVKDLDIPKIPYCEFLWKDLDRFAHLPGLVCSESGETLLYGEIREKSLDVSRSLRGIGLAKSDLAAILLPNSIQYPLIVQGCLHSGLTICPLSPAHTPAELTGLLKASNPKIIFTHSSLLEKVNVCKKASGGEPITVLTDVAHSKHDGTIGWANFNQISSSPHPSQVPVDVVKDIAVLPFSSGTTGVPKGVMLSQRNLISSIAAIIANDPEFIHTGDTEETQDVTLGVLPLYHIFGLNVTMSSCISRGAKHVILPTFQPQRYADLLATHRPKFLHLVPPIVRFLAQSPLITRDHLKSLRQVNVGAAPSGTELIKLFFDKAPKDVKYKEGWGLTEVAGAATGVHPAYGSKTGSVNFLLPNLRLQIRDLDSDQPLSSNQNGEIVVKGDSVMLGYFNNPQANSITFDKDGWMRTGDIGYYDDDGFIFIVDRQKELIKVKGLQVAPAELENIISGIPGVSDVGVIGVESDRSGEAPKAYIVLENGAKLGVKEIHEFMADAVASYKQLTGGIEFVKEIPKSPSGKILRRELIKFHASVKGK